MEVENQQLSEIVVVGTKYKTGREGDATIIHTEKFDDPTMLGEGSVRICERGADHGNILPALQESLVIVQSEKKRKDDQKILHEEESKESTMEEVNEREAEINGEQGSPPWQCQNFESFSYSKPSLSHCRRKKQKRRPENAA